MGEDYLEAELESSSQSNFHISIRDQSSLNSSFELKLINGENGKYLHARATWYSIKNEYQGNVLEEQSSITKYQKGGYWYEFPSVLEEVPVRKRSGTYPDIVNLCGGVIKFIVSELDLEIKLRRVSIFGRFGSPASNLELIAPTQWALISRIDWKTRQAEFSDGYLLHDLHVVPGPELARSLKQISKPKNNERSRWINRLVKEMENSPHRKLYTKNGFARKISVEDGTKITQSMENRIWESATEIMQQKQIDISAWQRQGKRGDLDPPKRTPKKTDP